MCLAETAPPSTHLPAPGRAPGATRRRGRPRHARRRPPVRRFASVLVGAIVGPLVLTVWLAGGGSANAAFAATTTVRPGDTLSAIASRYHTTVTALAAANGITNPNLVFAGAT